MSGLRSNCAHTSLCGPYLMEQMPLKELCLNQSFVHCKMPQGTWYLKWPYVEFLWWRQASLQSELCSALNLAVWNICCFDFLLGRGGYTCWLQFLTLPTYAGTLCASSTSHLLLIGMGVVTWLWVTFWHKLEVLDYSVRRRRSKFL